MATESRRTDCRYFDADGSIVGRTQVMRGDFAAYSGVIETTAENWWIERRGKRSKSSVAEIERLIGRTQVSDANGLARFFADSRAYGTLFLEDQTLLVDYEASFARAAESVFPRLEHRTLSFVVRKSVHGGDVGLPYPVEYWDIMISLDTLNVDTNCFWSGVCTDLVLLDAPNTEENFGSSKS